MDIEQIVRERAAEAKAASRKLAVLPTALKNSALLRMASLLEKRAELVLAANEEDLKEARDNGVKASFLDRLLLTPERIKGMADSLRATAALPDPVGEGDFATVRPNGLELRRVRVPLGVIAIIYEARPNVTAEAAGLCLKSGNAVLLRGGKEALKSNRAIMDVLREAAYGTGVPEGALGFIDFTDRGAVDAMLQANGLIDVVIPRGGAGLIKKVVENSAVPVIETGSGICHTFVDSSADFDMAVNIIVNAKTSRPSVCNALETLLVHEAVAKEFLPVVEKALRDKGVQLKGCEKCRAIVPDMEIATEADWATEYDDLILSIKVVKDAAEAIDHINRYNTGHSESIITNDLVNAHRFQAEVDAAAVYVNASTRFTDGFEFGFGAEIGISTQKLHARGPMGLRELTSEKYLIYGNGQTR